MSAQTQIDDLVSRWQARRQQGEEISPTELCRDCPELLPEVERQLGALRRMQQMLETADANATAPLAGSSSAGAAGAAPPRVLGGYEVLDELGRGGMGVVYQARQTALKRLVALKMILSGSHAGAEQRDRFRAEAEVVARLKHPHIVEIHDIGELDGQPYFALEFVEGGSLERKLAGAPLPAAQAAALVETLARAIHHAHQHGVVHRDLKPANVLLTADGQPKVTDFGLAKQLDADGRTATGAVMGTPSYMAPEQAAGKVKELGPPCDIYALGAILYECLTGRPPFRGPTMMETLRLVVHEPPPPVRKVNPQVPRDLETICHKCLHKDPRDRYRSALQLAQDLERYRGGESILARPEGPARKAFRVLRRRWPVVVSGLVIGTAVAVALVAFTGGRDARRVAELGRELEVGLDAEPAAWSAALVEQNEGRIAELNRLAPAEADAWRGRLRQKFKGAVLARIGAPRLGPDDRAQIDGLIVALARRWPEEERALRDRLMQRLRDWKEVAAVAAPFSGWDAVLAAADAQADGTALVSRVQRDPPLAAVIGPAARCGDNAEIEARWDESWTAARQIGVALNLDGAAHYRFVLSARSIHTFGKAVDADRSFAAALASGGTAYLQIWRGADCLREVPVTPGAGPLTLRARRQGDQLECQLDASPPARFTDAMPLPAMGSYGMLWPAGVRLVELRCRRQELPSTPSPLESADALFAQRRFHDALAAYDQPGLAAESAVGQEARYKAALCLYEMNRTDDAASRLERLVGETGERWPILAAYRLWLTYLDKNLPDKAEDAFHSLATRARPETVPQFVPEYTRYALLSRLTSNRQGMNYIRANPETCERIARTIKGFELLATPSVDRGHLHRILIRNRWMIGQVEQARADAEAWVTECEKLDPLTRLRYDGNANVLVDWAWLARGRGPAETGRALGRLDAWLGPLEALGDVELARRYRWPYSVCVLERARTRVALGDWAGAEKDVAACLRLFTVAEEAVSYQIWSEAHLMLGFLREHAGDHDGQRAAWQRGTYRGFREALPKTAPEMAPGSAGAINWWLMASATGTLGDEDAAVIFLGLMKEAGDQVPAQIARSAGVTPALLRRAAETPRGIDFARGHALGRLAFPDYMRGPSQLLFLEFIRDGAFRGSYTPEQEELVWRLSADGLALYAADRVSTVQAAQMALTWKGITGALGWGALSAKLPEELRGPLAYVFGQRMLQKQNPQAARTFFEAARNGAAAESALRRLAQAELDRLPAK